MNFRSLLALLALSSVASVSFANAPGSDFRGWLTRELPKVERAFHTKDMSYFARICAPDFTEKTGTTTVDRQQSMAQMKMSFGSIRKMDCHFKIISAKSSGKTGIAILTGHFTMITKPDAKGKSHKMVMDRTERDTWVRSGSGWKIKAIEDAKPSRMTMDGKPFAGG